MPITFCIILHLTCRTYTHFMQSLITVQGTVLLYIGCKGCYSLCLKWCGLNNALYCIPYCIHRVSKTVQTYFCSLSVTYEPISIEMGRVVPEETLNKTVPKMPTHLKYVLLALPWEIWSVRFSRQRKCAFEWLTEYCCWMTYAVICVMYYPGWQYLPVTTETPHGIPRYNSPLTGYLVGATE